MQGSSFTVEKPRKYYVQITHGPKQCKNNRTGHHLKLFCGQLWQNSLSTKCESQWFEILTEYSWVKQSTLNFPECVHDRQKALKAQNKVLYESVCVGGMTLVFKKKGFQLEQKSAIHRTVQLLFLPTLQTNTHITVGKFKGNHQMFLYSQMLTYF